MFFRILSGEDFSLIPTTSNGVYDLHLNRKNRFRAFLAIDHPDAEYHHGKRPHQHYIHLKRHLGAGGRRPPPKSRFSRNPVPNRLPSHSISPHLHSCHPPSYQKKDVTLSEASSTTPAPSSKRLSSKNFRESAPKHATSWTK